MMHFYQRLTQELTFARHVPPGQILRRLILTAKRHWSDVRPPRFDGPAPRRAAHLPQPVLALRTGMIDRDDAVLKLRFLDHEEPVGTPIDWSARDTGVAAQLWRMHLHYMEFLEEATAAEGLDWILHWIEDNPPVRNGFWRDIWFPYTISLRVVVWMQFVARHAEGLPQEAEARIAHSLAEQLRYLVDYVETDIGGNHLIKNAKALLWASAYFKGDEAENWGRIGAKLLRSELAAQILSDGVHFERSASYHAQVFADLIEIRSLPIDAALAADLDARLPAMAQILADLAHPDGLPAHFNDSGLTMAYAPQACLDGYARIGGTQPAPRAVFACPEAGYFGARNDSAYLVADCGPIGPDELPAHSHGDVLSFELSLGGERLIVDQGVFEYTAGDRRQASRSCAHHNTLAIEGADQADFFGRFRVGRRPRVRVKAWQAGQDSFLLEGEHDGFTHLPGRPRHSRRFAMTADGLDIEDRITGRASRDASIGFLLHPSVSAEPLSQTRWRLRGSTAEAILTCDLPVVAETACWWPDLGVEQPTQRLVVRASCDRFAAGVVSRIAWA
ncbi:heparinase II/III domain-containing protein [Rhizorhabdus sp. FW153]|uniref:heparinase II/III domain-containing protein n=1 Tax=Rhizorhabdus sp. FW153 TaxID=3400216 RepID=UPI003CF67BA9